MLSTLATFAPLKRKVFLEDLPFLGMGKAETGENFAGIILSLLFFHMHARNKNGEHAGKRNDKTLGKQNDKTSGKTKLQNRRENKMTEQNIMIFYQKGTSSLFLTQMNARGIERYSKHSSPTFLRRPLNCAVFYISFVIYCPLSTIQEQCQKIEYMFLATKTLKMEIPECL